MKTKLWILGCVLGMACGSQDDKPDHILSKEQMVALMIDVQMAQTRVNELRLKKDSAQKVYDHYQGYLLEAHEVKDSVFYESLQYYLNRPVDLDLIHEGVLDTLNFRLQKIEAQEEKDKKDKAKRDSVNSVRRKKITNSTPTKIS
jgi:hypothetical protein